MPQQAERVPIKEKRGFIMESYSYSYEGSPITSIISLVLVIIAIVGMWKVFSKAGVPGWHSIIPILNIYDICKIALQDSVGLFTILSILLPIVLVYPCLKLAKAFGKGTGFGILLFLFSFIGYPILGFGDAEYLGPQ